MDRVKNLAQAYKQTPWRKQAQFVIGFLLVLIFGALIAGVYLNVSARAAENGRKVLMMESEIERLKLENADLETKLGTLTSAAVMEARAIDMGFVPIQKGESLYIVVDGYIPRQWVNFAPPPPTVNAIAVSLPPDYTETLIDWLTEKVVTFAANFGENQP